MKYAELLPNGYLRQYVKCYFLFESNPNTEFEDKVFPGGHMEIIFNLGSATWESASDERFQITPQVELWGQLTKPLHVRTKGSNMMLGVRFFAHGASLLLKEAATAFNDKIVNLEELLGNSVKDIHTRLREARGLHQRIELLERYLQKKMERNIYLHRSSAVLINQIITERSVADFSESVDSLAARYSISPRYLQKLFLNHTGITPKFFNKINRFQRSLKYLSAGNVSLTAVAYDCGYYDQSHFIREFKAFTGLTPSEYSPETSPLNAVLVT